MVQKSNWRKAFTVAVAAALSAGTLLAGCGDGKAGDDGKNQPNGSGQSSPAPSATAKRLKVSMMYPLFGNPPQKTEVWKLIEDKFNIDFEPMGIPDNSYNDKRKVTIASGDMPDLMLWNSYPDPEFNSYAKQGAFLALDDWIKPYPNIMKTPQGVWDNVKVDGKIYGIPRTRSLNRSAVMIRKDWLDNLGLPIPKTVDDFYKTAVQFTTGDPDKNGKNDTFGIVMGENLSHVDSLFIAFGSGNGWLKKEDGTLINSAITPERKQALVWLRNLYKEGGVDKDFAVLKNTQVWEKLEGGKAGIMLTAQTSDFLRYKENLAKVDPKAQLIMIAPPVGPAGKTGFSESSGFFGQWVIPAKTDKEKVKRLLDLMEWESGDEAYALKRYGMEGIHHTKNADGTIKLNIDKYKADSVDMLIIHNPFDPYMYVNTTAPADIQKQQRENLDLVSKLGVRNPALSFLAPAAIEKQTDLDKLRDEIFVNIVMGTSPLDEFDKFVQEWLNKGGSKITQETNDWYKTQNK